MIFLPLFMKYRCTSILWKWVVYNLVSMGLKIKSHKGTQAKLAYFVRGLRPKKSMLENWKKLNREWGESRNHSHSLSVRLSIISSSLDFIWVSQWVANSYGCSLYYIIIKQIRTWIYKQPQNFCVCLCYSTTTTSAIYILIKTPFIMASALLSVAKPSPQVLTLLCN